MSWWEVIAVSKKVGVFTPTVRLLLPLPVDEAPERGERGRGAGDELHGRAVRINKSIAPRRIPLLLLRRFVCFASNVLVKTEKGPSGGAKPSSPTHSH